MSKQKGLIKAGLLNIDTDDLGILSTSKTKVSYNYYCSSFKCAGSKDTGEFKFNSVEWFVQCRECGQLLYSKRAK